MGKQMSVEQKYGEVKIQLQKPVYFPGEILQGVVHCNIQQELPTNIIILGIEGKEKVKMAKVYHDNNNNSHPNNQSRVEWEEDSEKICEYQMQLYNNQPGPFRPGHYSIPFQLALPERVPNSFDYRYTVQGNKCKAQIKYQLIAAILLPNTQKGIKGTQKIHIREPFPFNQVGVQQKNLHKKIEKEGIKFEAKISRDFFMFGESCHADLFVDNSQNKKEIKQLKWKLVQYIDMHSRNNKIKKHERTRIKKVKVEGVQPKGQKSQQFDCDIKKAIEKEVANLVSVKGKFIECVYKLEFFAVTPAFFFFSKDNKLDYEIKIFETQDIRELNQCQFYNQQNNRYQANHQQQYYQQMQYHQGNMNQQQYQNLNYNYPPNFQANVNPQQNNQNFPPTQNQNQNNYQDQSYNQNFNNQNNYPNQYNNQQQNMQYQPWNNQQYSHQNSQQQGFNQNQQYPPTHGKNDQQQNNQQFPPTHHNQNNNQQHQNQQYPPTHDNQNNNNQQHGNQQYPPTHNNYGNNNQQHDNQQYPPTHNNQNNNHQQQDNQQFPPTFNKQEEHQKNQDKPQISKIDQKLNEQQQKSLNNIQYPELGGNENEYNVDFSELDRKNQLF